MQRQMTVSSDSFIRNDRMALQPTASSGTTSIPESSNRDDFIRASRLSRPGVVFIKGIRKGQQEVFSPWNLFFRYFSRPDPSMSFGSGVIVNEDGYIVTNRHVVKEADRIEVKVRDRKKTYKATLIGKDASSDLALLKIEAQGLPALEYGNSEKLETGEWVLAVGNPFNLTSTVTAGIVSAKGRNINVVENRFPIESFIQTDAAINPGNSGGALVNLEGKLVGINSAIVSKTGSYTGYGFAIPVNIVKKIVEDLIRYGRVQRAFIEAAVEDLSAEQAERLEDPNTNGVVITGIYSGGAAAKAGLKKNDILLEFNGKTITGRGRFDELLAYHRPGDKIRLTVLRDDEVLTIQVVLTNSQGETGLLKIESEKSDYLGAEFIELTRVEKERFGIGYGVKVNNIRGGLMERLGIPDGFIILAFNGRSYQSASKLVDDMENTRGRFVVKGVSPGGSMRTYAVYVY